MPQMSDRVNVWQSMRSIFEATGLISSADITGTAAGQFGHAQGYEVVPNPGTGYVLQLLDAFVAYDFAVAAYGGGGNTTLNWSAGGAALTGLVSAANFAAAAADKPLLFYPLTTAAVVAVPATGISLVTAAAFTQPGTAAGVIKYKIRCLVVPTYL